MAEPVRINGLTAAGRDQLAADLVFEYAASTATEGGGQRPETVDEFPPSLRGECQRITEVYGPPGAFLVAETADEPIGCVGLRPVSSGSWLAGHRTVCCGGPRHGRRNQTGYDCQEIRWHPAKDLESTTASYQN